MAEPSLQELLDSLAPELNEEAVKVLQLYMSMYNVVFGQQLGS